MHCYARLLAHHPCIIIIAVTAVAITTIIISLVFYDLPNFEDPQLGFESRGTILAQRATAWTNLMAATKHYGPLTTNPLEHHQIVSFHKNFGSTTFPKTTIIGFTDENQTVNIIGSYKILAEEPRNRSKSSAEQKHELSEWDDLKHLQEDHAVPYNDHARLYNINQGFFCGEPTNGYARVIFQSTSHENLFTAKSIKSMCKIENTQLRSSPYFSELCEMNNKMECCHSWSIGNYVLLLRNKTSCDDLTDDDVNVLLEMLQNCSLFYYNLELKSDCYDDERYCRGVPQYCIYHNFVYIILHYLTDIHFLNPNVENNNHLTYAMSFLPIACSSKALPYFHNLEVAELSDSVTEIVAMEMGLKYTLFDEYLVHDTIFLGIAAGMILIFMWMYTSSLFITIMTVLAILFSLIIAYFIYVAIFNISFFPFMNLLTAIIIIGIGADDVFIYCKVWACAKLEKNNGTLVKLVNDTLKHASLSMFVTSLTTAAAFYSGFISNITAIKCFCIFAATTILTNFLLMLTWIPATIVIAEKWCSSNCCICIPPFGLYAPILQRYPHCSKFCNELWKLHYYFTDWARIFFEKILPCIVIKPRYLWIFSLGGIATCGAVVILYYPKLKLPDSTEFQIFSANHPFEKYDLVLKNMFWFEKIRNMNILSKLPLRIVWGIQPIDDGNYLNPYDKGSLIFDDTFNMASPESQKWLLSFCRNLRNQSFYEPTMGPLLPNCFIEAFKSWMEQKCHDPNTNQDRSPCCENSSFPYSETVFNKCIHKAVKSRYGSPAIYVIPGMAGPRFSTETGKIKAIVVEYDSVYSFSESYSKMQEFESSVDAFVKSMLETAPNGMKNGWFTSYLNFYDLQQSLFYGTLVAIGIAMAISFAVLFLTTLNILLSLYAIITITSIIFVTVGILVLLNWKMNVLESITITVAIGLAVDFTLHYGLLYKLSPDDDRESSVIFSLSRMGSPIAMAAFTTFVAGVCMMPSSVLAYIQIGTFTMIIMTISWIYGTFFFQSILRIIGPQKKFGQFYYPSFECCHSSNIHVDKTMYNYGLSESTISTSSTSYQIQNTANESHELEPLTMNAKLERSRNSSRSYIKHKFHSRSPRQRSGSLSVTFSDPDPTLSSLVSKSSRKVSLPIGAIDPSPHNVAVILSSPTGILSSEDQEQVIIPNKSSEVPDVWIKRNDED